MKNSKNIGESKDTPKKVEMTKLLLNRICEKINRRVRFVEGKLLTLIDATSEDNDVRKARKDMTSSILWELHIPDTVAEELDLVRNAQDIRIHKNQKRQRLSVMGVLSEEKLTPYEEENVDLTS